jgi:hypothetical protein
MAFEEIPQDVQQFFATGELPQSLASQQATTPTPEPVAATTPEPSMVDPASPNQPGSPPSLQPVQNAPDMSAYERMIEMQAQRERELRTQLESMQEQIKKMTATPAPDPTTDPLGYLNHQMKTIQDQIAAMNEQGKAQTQQTQQQNDMQQFVNSVNSQVNSFKTTHTDYDAAYKHVIDNRLQDFRDMGLTETQAQNARAEEERNIAFRAMQQGKNPAEVVYKMAQRMGYKAPDTAAATAKPVDKLETIRKGQEASKTVEAGSRVTEHGGVNREMLENASDSQLNEMVSNDWEKIFGKSKGIFG